MTSLIKIELDSAKTLYERLVSSGRGDTVAKIVLDRVLKEIQTLEKRVSYEENREKRDTYTSADRFKDCFRKIGGRIGYKRDKNNNSVSSISEGAALSSKENN